MEPVGVRFAAGDGDRSWRGELRALSRGLGTPLRVVDGGDARPGLDSCLRALRTGDVLVVWTLDRLGRTLAHLVNTVQTSTASTSSSKVFVRRGRGDATTALRHPSSLTQG